MGIEKRFNSICARLRKRLGITNSEDGDIKKDGKFDSVPDLRSRKSKGKKKARDEKAFGVSLARFDEDLVRNFSFFIQFFSNKNSRFSQELYKIA